MEAINAVTVPATTAAPTRATPAPAPTDVLMPQWVLHYEGRDVTRMMTAYVLSVEVTDKLSGEADELAVQVEDSDGRWRRAWSPVKGDKIAVWFGYAGRAQPAGTFEVTELEYDGPPSRLAIKAVAASVTAALRTNRSAAYEGQTLREIAGAVARRHGLTLAGDVDDIRIGRVTQNGERDLAFLKRLADDYGHVFTVRGDQLVFHRTAALSAAPVGLILKPGDLTRWRLADKVTDTYQAAKASYHDPATKGLVEVEVKAEGVKSGDTHRITDRSENKAQAEAKARTQLAKLNAGEIGGSLDLMGEPRLAAGSKLRLVEFGTRLDGDYLVETASHRIVRGAGYTTSVEIKRA